MNRCSPCLRLLPIFSVSVFNIESWDEAKSLLYLCFVCAMIDPLLQDDHSIPLSCTIFVGPNCDVEYQNENGEVCSN